MKISNTLMRKNSNILEFFLISVIQKKTRQRFVIFDISDNLEFKYYVPFNYISLDLFFDHKYLNNKF